MLWLRPVMAFTASMQLESGRIVFMPDLTSRIRLSSKEGMDRIVQNRVRSGWPGQGLAKFDVSGLEASRCAGIIGSGFWQAATGQLPLSDSVVFFHRRPGSYCAKPVRIRFSSGFGQTDPVRKQTDVQDSSGPLLTNASEPIGIGCESDPAD